MSTTLEDKRGSRGDRLWESALAQLTNEGLMGSEQVAVVVQRHHQMEEVERAHSRKMAVIELAGYLGAALTVGGVVAISSQVWGDFSEIVQVLVLAALAAGLLAAAGLVAGFAPDGPSRLRDPQQATRRRLVGVLGIAGAGLTAATISLWCAQSLSESTAESWYWTAALAALVIASVVSRFAPGVVPTLGVGSSLGATVLLGMQALGWTEPQWAISLALMCVAAFAALVLVRWLAPGVLVEAASVAAWLMAGIPMLGAEPGWGVTPDEASMMLWTGRIGVLALVAIGAVKFARGGTWPWAIGVAVGTAAFVGISFGQALGGAIGMTLAGVVLIVVAVLMLRAHRQGDSAP